MSNVILHHNTGELYTDDEIVKFGKELRIQEIWTEIEYCKAELSRTDYKAIKYAEGYISEADYTETKSYRQSLRDRVNKLEAMMPEEVNNG